LDLRRVVALGETKRKKGCVRRTQREGSQSVTSSESTQTGASKLVRSSQDLRARGDWTKKGAGPDLTGGFGDHSKENCKGGEKRNLTLYLRGLLRRKEANCLERWE